MIKIYLLSGFLSETSATYDMFETTPTPAHLALLGDTGHTKSGDSVDFLWIYLTIFFIILYALGNCEPYHSSHAASRQRLLTPQTETG